MVMNEKPSAAPALSFRRAGRADVPMIVALLADDFLGGGRDRVDGPLAQSYYDAFEAIDADPNHHLLLAEQTFDGNRAPEIVGCLHLTMLPGLSNKGALRALIEAVRVAGHLRGQGIGEALVTEALAIARARGAKVAQLTTDKRRVDAHRFYLRLGFVASHEGMKLKLD